MANLNTNSKIEFLADKVYVHKWPLNSPSWSPSFQEKIDLDLNKHPEKKEIKIKEKVVWINDYEFFKLKKIGITVPLFKRETTVVFESHLQDLEAHVHITVLSKNYLEIFNSLMDWRTTNFGDSD